MKDGMLKKLTLRFFIIVLISFTLVSCNSLKKNELYKYEVYWNDIRSEKNTEIICIGFANEDNSKTIKKRLKTGVTKKIFLPDLEEFEIDYHEYTCHSVPYVFNYFIDSKNKKIEFILVDRQFVQVNDYEATVQDVKNAVAYELFFADVSEKKWCNLISNTNTFKIEKSKILTEQEVDFDSIIKNLGNETIGVYTSSTTNFTQPVFVFYIIKSLISNEYIEISANYSDYVTNIYDSALFEQTQD